MAPFIIRRQEGCFFRLKQKQCNLRLTVRNILNVLNSDEKKSLFKLAWADIFINLLDIAFLAALVLIVNFYTQPAESRTLLFFQTDMIKAHPLFPATIFFILFTVKNIAGFLIFKTQYGFVYKVASRISGDNLLSYLRGNYYDYVHTDSAVFTRKVSQQPVEFSHYVLYGLQQVFSQMVLIIITIIAILLYNPLLLPLLVLALAPPVFLIAFLMKKKLAAVREHGKVVSERAIQYLQEALSGYIESSVSQKSDFFKGRYHHFQEKLNHYLAEKQVIQNMPSRLIEVFAVAGLFFLIAYSSMSNGGSIGIITIGAFMAAAYKVIPGIVKIMNTAAQMKTYAFTVTELSERKVIQPAPGQISGSLHSVRFENVSFSYGDKTIIKDLSVSLAGGTLLGISGKSGKGKTTLVNLLLGFLSPSAGTILVNDHAADADKRMQFRQRISYSKQQPFFIHDTLLKNITLEENGHDTTRLKRVMQITGLDNIVASGETVSELIVTEHGKNFSGGQRQRIIFARTLYRDADLLILDEPFSELDAVSEIKMLEQLQRLAKAGKIIILVTHNEDALSYCNKIISADEFGN